MNNIYDLKKLAVSDTPLLLFVCSMPSGHVERWSTHDVVVDGESYSGRIVKHNLFELRATSEDGIDGISRISLSLANADGYFSQLERSYGFKGTKVTVQFVFYDLNSGAPTSEKATLFNGLCNPPEEITESLVRVTFLSRLSLQRSLLPPVRIQRRCPWVFPTTASQRQEAVDGAAKTKYSPLYRCGYSPDIAGGVGSMDVAQPFTSCDYTRTQSEARGIFASDASGRATGRFGGIEFVPSSVLAKSYGAKSQHLSTPVENEARYNDFVPIVYGTAWYRPPVIFARNDGNLTHLEVLLGMGEIYSALKWIANNRYIPQ